MTLLNPSTSVDQHTILAELADLPPKSPRSKLEPHRELIRELRRRGRTYREVAQLFRERLGLYVAPSTLHSFVKVRARHRKRTQFELPPPESMTQELSAVDRRIAALKSKPSSATAKGTRFVFRENEPLTLTGNGGEQ